MRQKIVKMVTKTQPFLGNKATWKVENKQVFHGDNLEIMRKLEPNKIQLIYIDPPFGSGSVRKSKAWGGEKIISFNDNFRGGIQSYIHWLVPRLRECYRLLSPTGVFCLHLDHGAVHYAKVELDKIFGYNNFINCVSWKRYAVHTLQGKGFDSVTECILIYAKQRKAFKFNQTFYKTNDEKELMEKFKYIEKETGKRYQHCSLEKSSNAYSKNEIRVINGKKVKTKIGWIWTQKTFNERLKKNKNLIHWTKKGRPRYKLYLDDYEGVGVGDLWYDKETKYLSSGDSERLGYPTQKPLALLNRIVKAFTDKGDMVLDSFCGCGTTISSAQKLGRRWIGIDKEEDAISTIKDRMAKEHKIKIKVTKIKTLSEAEIYRLSPLKFEKKMIKLIGGTPNQKQSGDRGVDGRYFDNTPIQVKKSFDVGRPVIDSFYKHVKNGNGKGIIIARSFTRGAHEEVARLQNEEGLTIYLIYAEDIIRDFIDEETIKPLSHKGKK